MSHRRLLQTEAVFVRGLELATEVSFAEQFIQIMSTYCHIAIENASGYHADKILPPTTSGVIFRHNRGGLLFVSTFLG